MSMSDNKECVSTKADCEIDALSNVEAPISDSKSIETNLKSQKEIDESGGHLPLEKTENDIPEDTDDTSAQKNADNDKIDVIPVETQIKVLSPLLHESVSNLIEELKTGKRSSYRSNKDDVSENDECVLKWDDDEEVENFGEGTEKNNITVTNSPEKDILKELDAQRTKLDNNGDTDKGKDIVDETHNDKANLDKISDLNTETNQETCTSVAKIDGIDVAIEGDVESVEIMDNVTEKNTEIDPRDTYNDDIILDEENQDNKTLDKPSVASNLFHSNDVENTPMEEQDELEKETEISTTAVENTVPENKYNANNASEEINKTFDGELSFIEPIEHNLNQPNFMTEIPTQEIIDITDDLMDTTEEDVSDSDSTDKLSTVDNDNTDSNEKSTKIVNVEETGTDINVDSKIVANMDVDSDNVKSICESEPVNEITPLEEVVKSKNNEDITEIEAEVDSKTDLSSKAEVMKVDCEKSVDIVNTSSVCLSDHKSKEIEQDVSIQDEGDHNLNEISTNSNLEVNKSKVETIETAIDKPNDICDKSNIKSDKNIKSQTNNSNESDKVEIKDQIDENASQKEMEVDIKDVPVTNEDQSETKGSDPVINEDSGTEGQEDIKLNKPEEISSEIDEKDSTNDNTVKEVPTTVDTQIEEIKTADGIEKSTKECIKLTKDGNEPSTSKETVQDNKIDTNLEDLKETVDKVDGKDDTLNSLPVDDRPSTSKIQVRTDLHTETVAEMAGDDTASEMTDSLGLLAECSRVRDDDDEPEPESEHDEDDDDFYQFDESSNQMVDQSEDSAQQSESDFPRVQLDKDIDSALDADSGPSAQTSPDGLTTEEFNFDIEAVEDEKDVVLQDDSVCAEVEVTATEDIPDVEMVDETTLSPAPAQPDSNTANNCSLLRSILAKSPMHTTADKIPEEETKTSPSKFKKLEISQPKHIVNIVDLEESSSEDDIPQTLIQTDKQDTIITIDNIPDLKDKPADTEPPEAKKTHQDNKTTKTKGNLEVFNLDSEDEDTTSATSMPVQETQEPEKQKLSNRCVNNLCTSESNSVTLQADAVTRAYYDSQRRSVCGPCASVVGSRTQNLLEGIKNFTPIHDMMDMSKPSLVEILDSESDDEGDTTEKYGENIGVDFAKEFEGKLASMFNETWLKYDLDKRLKDTEDKIQGDIDALELQSSEVNAMLDECQRATDRLRAALYAAFEPERVQLAPLVIVDTPESMFSYVEPKGNKAKQGQKKRRLSSDSGGAAKKHVISPAQSSSAVKTDPDEVRDIVDSKMDDDKDISVVTLSAEEAPAELPPLGDMTREPLRPGMEVYAMRNLYGSWQRAKIMERVSNPSKSVPFTHCRVKFELRGGRSAYKVLPARLLAYLTAPPHRLTIGNRVIALFKDNPEKIMKREPFYSGVIAENPNPVNKYRYLVFFDDGYAQYVQHSDTRLVCEFCSLVWEEVHPYSRDFVREYLIAYPERPMVRLHQGQSIKTEWNGKWWTSRVIGVDASLVHVYFEHDKRTEWIYRGSTRLAPLYLERQNAGKIRTRPLPRNRMLTGSNMPYVEYTRTDEIKKEIIEVDTKVKQEEFRCQRAVAKKSTTQPQPPVTVSGNIDSVTSRVVYYTPKNAIKPHKMVAHSCGPHCKRTDVLALSDLRTYNPLAKPLLSGWERQIVRYKGIKEVMYRAPCGRRLRNMAELHRYLQLVKSDMPVDLFHFGANIHCLAEFVLNKCIVGKKDLSHGKENVPVPCVNYYDGSLPEFCSYNTERTPTAGVPLNLDPDFLCGCDCTDDCQDKSKCACWKMTLEGARTIGLEGDNVGYEYKRLPEPLPSGIYECNVRCKCKSTCLNRVAQHPLQLKLQVFKTINRGWGIRALNDVPAGAFLCVYAGNLLTDATANLDGLNEGDEYLAELDYIEVVEQMKEGYEDDIPEQDKKLDKQQSGQSSELESTESESENELTSRTEQEDDDFQPGYITGHVTEFSKRLRKRNKDKKDKEVKTEKEGADKEKTDKEGIKEEDEFITISDDEELREPARFAAQAGMGARFVPKYKSVRSYFGKDEACYIMDAKVQGNIGRYLNHSCSPNVFVQNVFVDTHDPRFPWVAFFALSHIRAGTELTWNYNYDVGSVPGKALYCYCGAPNCRGRLL